MELSITDKKENKSLARTEITAGISFDKAVPSRKEIREALCAAAGIAPELLTIVSVRGSFGTQKAIVTAHAYASKEAASVERKYLLIRDGLAQKEEKKKEGKKAPAKK
jgi:ribosomal protein S24E